MQQVWHGECMLQPLQERHVDSLYPDHLTLLTQPAKLLSFDFQSPQTHCSSTVEVHIDLHCQSVLHVSL